MPTLEELIEQFGVASPPEVLESREDAAWRRLRGEWPAFAPPPLPRAGLTIEWLWWHVLDDAPDRPDAEELRSSAEAEDRLWPETVDAQYRRAHPQWLDAKLAWNAEYCGRRRWERLEEIFEHGGGLPPERVDWLRAHEEAVRPVLEEAKAAHFRRYSIGTFWFRPDADGTVSAWKRERWPAPEDRDKVPVELCTRWTKPDDRAGGTGGTSPPPAQRGLSMTLRQRGRR